MDDNARFTLTDAVDELMEKEEYHSNIRDTVLHSFMTPGGPQNPTTTFVYMEVLPTYGNGEMDSSVFFPFSLSWVVETHWGR
ncbi:hypothetical protein AVEN_99249-1 [Araneus ventricosus]|uniref:Uncharacterized protein n=1 Tax=Araneus ventricosus TaxID=182803 RepID=A0A4Y2QXK3_ARAVE|nr:hypothetical protein AVEN_99249-1 [Araneus ventricosus]